jgi:hypothetical protein
MKHHSKTRKTNSSKKYVFTEEEYNSGDGMLTMAWGPAMWHYLHMMSFNYPINPTEEDKKHYRNFILNLQNVLPCKYCRINLKKNLKSLPLTNEYMKNREEFSKYIYNLHEHINKMLGKKSGLSYEDVRERYEHFRARCVYDIKEKSKNKTVRSNTKSGSKSVSISKSKTKTKTKELGCTEPLYGKKSKCIIKIVPQENKCNTFQMDNKCLKTR